MSINIMGVESLKDLKQFIQLPYNLYKGNSYWAPPIKAQEKSFLTDIPTIDGGIETKLFLAKDDAGIVLGRIQVIINQHEIKSSAERIARFNKIEFIENQAVCRALLNAAENWAKKRNITKVIGPCGYTNFDATGVLLKGYDELSNASTIYNLPYYGNFIESCGYTSCLESLEYEFTAPDSVPKRITKISNLIKERYGLRYAEIASKKQKLLRTRQMFELFNICNSHLPTFIPVSKELKEYYYKKYVTLIKNEYMSMLINQEDELVGFGLAIPSYSKALQKAKGNIYPFGFYHLWKAAHKSDRVELLLIGVHPDYQKKGITSMIFEQIIQGVIKNGIKKVESNPELEENVDIQNLWKEYDFRVHKKRASYYKILSEDA